MMIADTSELLDVLDENDNVIGEATKDEVHAKKLRHKIAYVLVYNSNGELLLQRRSKHKGYAPNTWTHSVGGFVKAGESMEQGALREMQEELGVQAKLEFKFNLYYPPFNKVLGIFTAIHEGPFSANEREIESIKFFTQTQIKEMLKQPQEFHPELLFTLKKRPELLEICN